MTNELQPKTQAVRWEGSWREGQCVLLDQTRLPAEEKYVAHSGYRDVIQSIRHLVVRGAPAIGVAGAYAVFLAARNSLDLAAERRVAFLEEAMDEIAGARPTAINL